MERTNVPDNAIYSDPGYKTLKHLQNQERKKIDKSYLTESR